MKKIHCYEEGHCVTEENGKYEILTPFNQKYSILSISAILMGILAVAFIASIL